jgi:hypothetical protein
MGSCRHCRSTAVAGTARCSELAITPAGKQTIRSVDQAFVMRRSKLVSAELVNDVLSLTGPDVKKTTS